MGRRRRADNTEFMMDIMTAAIGCLVLILIAVLIIILVANVSIFIGNPENLDVSGTFEQYIPDVYDVDQPFPDGNTNSTPFYIDVWRDKLVFYPGLDVMSVLDVKEPVNAFTRMIDTLKRREEEGKDDYIVLLIRPYSAKVANFLRQEISAEGIRLGYELFEANKEIVFKSMVDGEMVELRASDRPPEQ